jgi:rRNA maturation RNase YbeY
VERLIEGDIYISIDRVKENAEKFGKEFTNELQRVMIHGVLHLAGYKDKNAAHQKEMRSKEDAYLSLYK